MILSQSCGGSHSLALCSDGALVAWGANSSGQLGDNTTTSNVLPVEVIRTGALAGKTVVALSAGVNHSLALCADGTVAAWGANDTGQLGNMSTSNSSVPVLVDTTGVLAGTKVVAVAAGSSHNLALCANGRVVAWGSGVSGQLGEDSVENRLVPVWVSQSGVLAGKTVVSVAAGGSHSLALCSDGAVTAWGANDAGQLGNNSTTGGFVPANVVTSGVLSGKTVVAVAAGYSHSLALLSDGTLAAWGANESGELGDNSTTNRSAPVAVIGGAVLAGKSVVTIAGGSSTSMALCADATLAAWGANNYGQLGDSTTTNRSVPVVVLTTPLAAGCKFAAVATGPSHSHNLALAAVPFNNTNLSSLVINDGSPLAAIPVDSVNYAACVPHSVASVTITPTTEDADARVTVNGTVVPSGAATGPLALALGNNTITIQVTAPDGATITNHTLTILRPDHLSATFTSATAVPVTSAGYDATGLSANFALGFAPPAGTNLTLVNNTGPARITGTFANLAHNQSVALTYNNATYRFVVNYYGGSGNDLVLQWANQKPYAWGDNTYGQLGNNSTTNRSTLTAVDVTGVLKGKVITALAAGNSHSLALCADGTVAAWGRNTYGQLGNNSTTGSSVPVTVTTTGALAGKTVIALAAGDTHSLALCSDGTVAAWGSNGYGQLGNNSVTGNGVGIDSGVPVAVDTSGVLSGKTVVAIAAGAEHSLVLCSDGTMAAWGGGINYGSLGNGSMSSSRVPVAVTVSPALLGKTVTAVAAGAVHNLALCSDGTVVGWGPNSGALGTGDLSSSTVPVAVKTTGLLSGKMVTAIAAGGGYSLALCSDGTLAAWGANNYGQLGNNSTTTAYEPIAVTATGALSGKTVAGIAAGASHSFAWCADGTLVAWGYNSSGQLGTGNTTNSSVPVAVLKASLGSGETVAPIERISNANHAMALAGVPFANSKLAGLVLSQAPLFPVLSADTTSYSACVANSTAAVTVTATTDDPDASVKVNGIAVPSGIASGPVAVAMGTTAITVAVTSPDRTSTTSYTISVLRPSPVTATFNSAGDIPVTTASYDATGLPANLSLGFAPPVGTNLTVVKNTGPGFIAGNFANLAQGQLVTLTYNNAIYRFVANYYGGSGNDLVLQWAQNRVFAWGYNQYYQLGNGSSANSLAPAAVPGSGVLADKTILALAKGGSHSLALCSDGTLTAWGYNSNGQLGNGGTTQSPVPVAVNIAGVLAGKTVVVIDAGNSYSLAVCSDGAAAAWGYNSYGQLGNNSTTNSSAAVAVAATPLASGEKFVGLATGPSAYHSLAVVAGPINNSKLAGLAFGASGPLPGFAPSIANCPASVPHTTVSVTVIPTVADPDALVRVNGTAVASSADSAEIPIALGSNTITVMVTAPDRSTVTNYVLTVVRAAAVTASYTSASDIPVSFSAFDPTGLTVDLSLGFAPVVGTTLTVVQITGPGCIAGRFANLAQGQEVNLAYQNRSYRFVADYYGGTGNDLVLRWAFNKTCAWGYNNRGQLGNNSTTNSGVPVDVSAAGVLAGKTIITVAAGGNHSLALSSDGTVAAWGYNNYGQLGDGTTANRLVPVDITQSGVLAGKTVVAVAAGVSHSLALCADGTVAAWGYNGYGQLGNNSTTDSRVPVAVVTTGLLAGKKVVAVDAGGSASLALCENGTLVGWGDNGYGQLGIGNLSLTMVPVAVNTAGTLSGKTVLAISVGSYHALALCSDGTVAAWGNNASGQLGNSSTTSSNVPVEVSRAGVLNNRNVVAVAAGLYHSLALCADGTLAAWGSNSSGGLGNGGTTSSSVPVAVVTTGALSGKTGVTLAAGSYLSLAGCSDGTLAAWGNNSYGQLGNNSTTSSSVPVPVDLSGMPANQRMVAVAATSQHVLALAAVPLLPEVATLPATDITATSVTLNGTANACGDGATVAFEYGPTGDYGSSVDATPSPVTGTTITPVTAAVSGLLAAATYHYRVLATSAGGTMTGADTTFTTLSDNANLITYAFGLDAPGAGALPRGNLIGDNYVIEFTQPPGVTGITYGAEYSTTLLPGSWTEVPDSGTGAEHIFSVPVVADGGLFMRLRVTGQ